MNAEQFCAEHGRETATRGVTFLKRDVDRFIETYTYLTSEDFTPEMRQRLKVFVMIGLYQAGISKYMLPNERNAPAEKIELPEIIFK